MDNFNLNVENLSYKVKSLSILSDINLNVKAKQGLIIKGESGRGKTTLLKMLTGLEKPSSGSISFNDIEINKLNQKEKAHFRRRYMGIAFQNPHIVPSLNVRQNIALALQIHDPDKFHKTEPIDKMLEAFEISHRADAYIETLSGGEARRVALARAFVASPKIVVLDEPLSGLDKEMSERMVQTIAVLRDENQALLIIATHNMKISKLGRVKLDMDEASKSEEAEEDSAAVEAENVKKLREATQEKTPLTPSFIPPKPEPEKEVIVSGAEDESLEEVDKLDRSNRRLFKNKRQRNRSRNSDETPSSEDEA